jgi:hypothetical protein
MPQWIHDRARHIQAKNPGMDEGKAFAIATQQAHSVGKSPKGYGTSEGRREARSKYDTPSDDKKTADPGGIGKEAFSRDVRLLAPLLDGFSNEMKKLAAGPISRFFGRQVVNGITENPANRAKAEQFVRNAAWEGVKGGLKRNAGRIAVGGGLVGTGAVAMHRHGKTKAKKDREQLLEDLSSRVSLRKKANLSGATATSPLMQPPAPPSSTSGMVGSPASLSRVKSTPGKYSKTHAAGTPGPASQLQPVLSPPAVRG